MSLVQKAKLWFGDALVSATNRLPVDIGGNVEVSLGPNVEITNDVGNPIPVSGTLASTVADGANVALGTTTDAAATGNGSVIGLLKQVRSLVSGGLPAALGTQGALKVEGVASGTAQSVDDLRGAPGVPGVPIVGSRWTAKFRSASNGVASIAKAAGGAGVRNVVTTLVATLASDGTASSTAGATVVRLFDGATIVFEAQLSMPATAGESRSISLTGLNIVGTANAAFTLDFSGAAADHMAQAVFMAGYQVS